MITHDDYVQEVFYNGEEPQRLLTWRESQEFMRRIALEGDAKRHNNDQRTMDGVVKK